MKKYLVLCVGCLPIFITSCFGTVIGEYVGQTQGQCAASCAKTHCCTTGKVLETLLCPPNWTLNGTECVRAPETVYSEALHRYETTSYSSCEATASETAASWICTDDPSTGSDIVYGEVVAWVDCCAIDGDSDLCVRGLM